MSALNWDAGIDLAVEFLDLEIIKAIAHMYVHSCIDWTHIQLIYDTL